MDHQTSKFEQTRKKFEQKWKLLLENTAHILKYMVLQQLGWGRGNVVIFLFFFFMLLFSIAVALLLLL